MSALNVMLFGTGSNVVVTAGMARGVFARHDLVLDLAYTQGSEMLCETLRTGGCDIGVLAADDVVYEVERRGLDFFLFMGIHTGLLSLMAHPEITTLGGLAGRRFGVDDTASGFVLLARRILRDHGLVESDYALVKAKGMNLRAQALENGEIDAALLSPPFTLRLLDRGYRELARVHDFFPRYQAGCWVTTREWATTHEDELTRFVRAYLESLAWTLDPKNREPAAGYLAQEFKLEPDIARRTYDLLADSDGGGLFREAAIDVPGIQVVIDMRVDAGLLPSPPPPASKYYDARYLERARSGAQQKRGMHG
jgi:ABC-type nitrate/sulfonate/bicarbonate transport system substrate-binding protein